MRKGEERERELASKACPPITFKTQDLYCLYQRGSDVLEGKGNTDCMTLAVLWCDLLIILNYESFQSLEIVGLRLMHIDLREI